MLSLLHTLTFLKAVESQVGVNDVRHEHTAVHIQDGFYNDVIRLQELGWKVVAAPNGPYLGPIFLERLKFGGGHERLELVSLKFPTHTAFAVSSAVLLLKLVNFVESQSVLFERLPKLDVANGGTTAVMFRCRGSDQFIQLLHRTHEIFTDIWKPYQRHTDPILANGYLITGDEQDIGLADFLEEHGVCASE